MAWTTPRTSVTGEVHTAAMLNETRDNLNALKPTTQRVNAVETETNTAYDDMATAGPAVTLDTGTTVTLFLAAYMDNSAAGGSSFMGVAVSGATTRAADDDHCIRMTGTDAVQCGGIIELTGLTAGSNTFTAKYKQAGASTATFASRVLSVIGV